MSRVRELFGLAVDKPGVPWIQVVTAQHCPFLKKRCYKVRKSNSEISIGTCTVENGLARDPVMSCPARLIDRRQIFIDCLHLLTLHEPGNELHIISEVGVPGGSVDYFLVSARERRVRDFVGIELQTLDTTGTVWPERQRLLRELGVPREDDAETSLKSFAMNWKMTAKTILVQMHHKVETFEHVNKKIVLVVQDKLLSYMSRQFSFGHLSNPPRLGDAMHVHAYSMSKQENQLYRLLLSGRLSTDAQGVALSLGLQAEARIELEVIVAALESKMSQLTLFEPV